MALCLANSLVACCDFSPYDQLVRYKWWYKYGYMSSTGQCFDIGATTCEALRGFERRQRQYANARHIPAEDLDSFCLLDQFDVFCSADGAAGNGALMRLAPVPLFFYKDPISAVKFSGLSGVITHGDRKAYDACRYYGALIVAALQNETKEKLLDNEFYEKHEPWFQGDPLVQDVMEIARGSYKKAGKSGSSIRGTGYIINSLEAALWTLYFDDDCFETGALQAVNLGDDTDTTAAIYGQLAGALYGFQNLPQKWVKDLYANGFINCLSKWLVHEGHSWQPKFHIPNIPQYLSQPLSNTVNNSSSSAQALPTKSTLTQKPSSAPASEPPHRKVPPMKMSCPSEKTNPDKAYAEAHTGKPPKEMTSAAKSSRSDAGQNPKRALRNASGSQTDTQKKTSVKPQQNSNSRPPPNPK